MLRTISLIGLILSLPVAAVRQTATAAEDYWPGWLGSKRNVWVNNFQPSKKVAGEITADVAG